MRRPISLILALAAVTIAAGCGGSAGPSRAEYEQAVQTARTEVDDAVGHLGQGVKSREDLAGRLERAAVVVDRVAEDLDERGAPKDLQDENERLVTNLRQLAVDVADTGAQFRDPTFADVFTQTQALQWESWTRANRVLRELQQQGLDVEPWA